jgi:hypothetical protein
VFKAEIENWIEWANDVGAHRRLDAAMGRVGYAEARRHGKYGGACRLKNAAIGMDTFQIMKEFTFS